MSNPQTTVPSLSRKSYVTMQHQLAYGNKFRLQNEVSRTPRLPCSGHTVPSQQGSIINTFTLPSNNEVPKHFQSFVGGCEVLHEFTASKLYHRQHGNGNNEQMFKLCTSLIHAHSRKEWSSKKPKLSVAFSNEIPQLRQASLPAIAMFEEKRKFHQPSTRRRIALFSTILETDKHSKF